MVVRSRRWLMDGTPFGISKNGLDKILRAPPLVAEGFLQGSKKLLDLRGLCIGAHDPHPPHLAGERAEAPYSPVKVNKALQFADTSGAKRVVPLQVSAAFHSPLMEVSVPGLRNALEEVTIADPTFPVVSNVTAPVN